MNPEKIEKEATINKEKLINKLKNDRHKLEATDENQNDNDDGFVERKKKSEIFKRFLIRIFVIHLGIYILTAAYVISGAFLFQLLEKQNFIENCQTGQGKTNDLVKTYRSNLFNYIYFNTTRSYLTNPNATNKLDTPNVYGPFIKKMITDFRDEVLKIQSQYKYFGQDCFKENMWSFESSFLLTITIVSTLGYGHITPTTWQGQVVCICYATIGIPIFLMAVNNISTLLSDVLIKTYRSIVYRSKKNKNYDTQEENLEDNSHKNFNHDGQNGLKIERENTVGVIGSNHDKTKLNLVINDEEDSKNDDVLNDKQENDDGEEDEEEEKKINVPLILILIIFGSYLYIGGYGFTRIEKWTIIQAVYYAFVSVSTIGLGDLVPGIKDLASGKEKDAAGNLLIAIGFIFVGIAILGMCFKLIQDTITEKIQFVSNLLGITSDESSQIDENINKTSANTNPDMNSSSSFQASSSDFNEKLKYNDDILMVKPPTRISSSRLIENVIDTDGDEPPVPVIPGPTMTIETKSEIKKLSEHNIHSSITRSSQTNIDSKSKEPTEVRIRNKVKPAEFG